MGKDIFKCVHIYILYIYICQRCLSGKESSCSAEDSGSVPGSGRSAGEGNGNSLWYSCLRNRMDGGAWWATVHGVTRIRHDLLTKPPPPLCVCVCVCV